MQYLLTEDEYKKLADVELKAQQIADSYRNRLCVEIIAAITALPDFNFDPSPPGQNRIRVIHAIRRALNDTPVIK